MAALKSAGVAAVLVLSSPATRCGALSFRTAIPRIRPRGNAPRRSIAGSNRGGIDRDLLGTYSVGKTGVRSSDRMLPHRGGVRRPSAAILSAAGRGGGGGGGGSSLSPSSLVNEDSFLAVPPDAVLAAIQSSSDAVGRIVASDVAASAGISLSQARRDLQTLATLTGAGMAVTEGGEIVYAFPYDLRGALKRKSTRYRARALAKRAWPGVFYAVRTSFGIMMLLSLLTIFMSLAALSTAAEAGAQQDDDERRGR
eukprot:CAMPEP_0113566600 /NCGR_PEP_ID=MMETSP0015_2-20120614/22811_1 /TAXON_ID=2838 /ORGANISM="Odontella" /LENGTH=253 /DNA_ID=CAMNT_0000468903 /DNA_START=109 /DNA_END=866 /DNA_ORIENTATION=- /assembly_acc=CAM_ASM_000160